MTTGAAAAARANVIKAGKVTVGFARDHASYIATGDDHDDQPSSPDDHAQGAAAARPDVTAAGKVTVG